MDTIVTHVPPPGPEAGADFTPPTPRKHTASLGDNEQWPGLRLLASTEKTRAKGGPARPIWFRLVSLLHSRGVLGNSGMRLARHLSQHAEDDGTIPDMGDAMSAYEAFYGVSKRTAWNDVKRLGIFGSGLIRQVSAPAPGRTATYRLCLPQEVPQGLPDDVAAALRRDIGRPRAYTVTLTGEPGTEPEKVTKITTAFQAHADLAETPMASFGSVDTIEPETVVFPMWLHTSPLSRGLVTPAPKERGPRRTQRPSLVDNATFDKLIDEVFDLSRPRWAAQRDGRGLAPDAEQRLRPLVRGALFYHTKGEVRRVITEAVATARDLGAVVASRLRDLIVRERRAAQVYNDKVDDSGTRYRKIMEEFSEQRRAAYTESARSSAAGARAALARLKPAPIGLADRSRAIAVHTPPGAVESEAAFAAELASAGIPVTDQARQAAEREARRRMAIARARAEKAEGARLGAVALVSGALDEPAF